MHTHTRTTLLHLFSACQSLNSVKKQKIKRLKLETIGESNDEKEQSVGGRGGFVAVAGVLVSPCLGERRVMWPWFCWVATGLWAHRLLRDA